MDVKKIITKVNNNDNLIKLSLSDTFSFSNNFDDVETIFITNEVNNVINPIIDYDKVKFEPYNIDKIEFNVSLLNNNNYINDYYGIGFEENDLKYSRNNYKQTNLVLYFYDSDNTLTQNLISQVYYFNSTWKNGSNIPLINFKTINPLISKIGNENFCFYYYRDFLKDSNPNYLYMRAVFNNAKTGKQFNLIPTSNKLKLNEINDNLFIRFKFFEENNKLYYDIDVDKNDKNVKINLYQINVV